MREGSKISSRRYQGDKLDFIIPFLINHTTQRQSPQKTVIVQPRQCSQYNTTCGYTDLQQIAKIYNVPKKKSVSIKKSFSKSHTKPVELSSKQILRHASNVSELLPSKCVTPQRFTKVKSQMCHQPISDFSPSKMSRSYRKSVKVCRVQMIPTQDTSLLGIKFKNKTSEKKQRKVFIRTPDCEGAKVEEFNGQVRKKVKQFKEKRQWERMRSLNVDAIINRKCKSFQQLMSQYRRRMGLEEISKVFVFDSKDLWLKRVLLDRGWIQNTNIDSKAFHLSWSNKIYKETLFQQQKVNHYPNCYYLTTKIGLFNLLRKYQLSYLQPKTFDLAIQKDAFVTEFFQREFVRDLKQFLDRFQFEDEPQVIQIQTLAMKFDNMVQLCNKINPIERCLSRLMKYCASIVKPSPIKTQEIRINFNELYNAIKAKTVLTEVQEQSIRLLLDFSGYVDKQMGLLEGNYWITKSKLSSKGVGISLHNELQSILKHENRLVQKYIEKPLIFENSPFKGRKFDLRIWVLLVGSDPETYYHSKFYGRTCYDLYSLDSSNIKNESIHLTNYSQNKKVYQKNNELHQSIIFPEELFASVKQRFGIDYQSKFYSDVQRLLRKLSHLFTLQIGGKDTSNHFQLFGCDVLLDESLHMYLLEINMSASCKERHPKLTTMLEELGNGMMNILERQQKGNLDAYGWVRVT